MIKLIVTRNSVCAADDLYAPHLNSFSLKDNFTIEDVASVIQKSNYLPKIDGGKATWSLASGIPIAVIAEQWVEPKMTTLTFMESDKKQLDVSEGVIRVHVNYHAQIDPNIVLEVLRRLQLKSTAT